MQRDLSYARV